MTLCSTSMLALVMAVCARSYRAGSQWKYGQSVRCGVENTPQVEGHYCKKLWRLAAKVTMRQSMLPSGADAKKKSQSAEIRMHRDG